MIPIRYNVLTRGYNPKLSGNDLGSAEVVGAQPRNVHISMIVGFPGLAPRLTGSAEPRPSRLGSRRKKVSDANDKVLAEIKP